MRFFKMTVILKTGYDSYEIFSEDIRVKGKDYSIIPEYRSSDFINADTDIFDVPDILLNTTLLIAA